MLFIRLVGKALLFRIRQAGPTKRFYFKRFSGYRPATKAILNEREWWQMLGSSSPTMRSTGRKAAENDRNLAS